MKKILKAAAIAALAALCLTSCARKEDTATQWQIVKFSVSENNWELCASDDGSNPFYRATLDIPELTSDILNEGAVLAYIYVGSNQESLPYVRHYENYYTDSEGKEACDRWTQTIDMEFMAGKAFVYSTVNDFYTGENPGNIDFRIVLIY